MDKNTHQVTIFQNIKDTSTPFHRGVQVIFHRIKDGKSKEIVEKIRSYKDKNKRNEIKKDLPAICFSGEFNKRKDSSIINHSGLICLDFDNFESESKLKKRRKELEEDKYSMAVFTSPSGNGLKAIVKIPKDVDKHRNYFNSLQNYYDCEYFDVTCKNISRVCYESYDPKIYINLKSTEWTKIIEEDHEHISKDTGRITIKVDDQDEIVRRLTLWWQNNYGMTEGERNNNAYVLASAFNDFGVNKDIALFILKRFQMKGFPENEISAVINSAYQNAHKFNTKFFEDRDRVNSVRDKIRAGVSKKEIRSQLIDSGVEGEVADAVISEKENESNTLKFWNKNDRGVVSVIHFMFRAFLQDLGYFKYYPNGSNNFIFVKIRSNIVDNTIEESIKDEVLNHLQQLDDLTIYNYFADKTRFFKEDFLNMLDAKDIPFLHDAKNECYIYYSNCAVKIERDEISVIQYENLDGYIWKDQIIDREFMMCDSTSCDYKTFLENICNNNQERIESVRSTIGFLLHGHKDKSFCPAIIVNDEVISDNPEGGTGKGLLIQGISEMKKNILINGKEFAFDKSFAYQLVSADTQVLTFDDVRKNFNFENLFSVITEGITLEKKNKDAIKIPYERSPKIVITTNYAIKGKGSSFERRKWELELTRHYHSGFTPYDEFKRLLFDDWDEDEWCRFDNYMINNIKYYMKKGFVKSKFKNLSTRKFIAETNHDFYEWVMDDDNNLMGYKLHKGDVYNQFVVEYPDYSRKLSRKMFIKWMKSYSQYITGQDPEEGRDQHGRYMIINHKQDEQLEIDI